MLKAGLGGLLGVAAAGAVGVELVNHGVLPGKATLDRIDGACVVPAPRIELRAGRAVVLWPLLLGRAPSDRRASRWPIRRDIARAVSCR